MTSEFTGKYHAVSQNFQGWREPAGDVNRPWRGPGTESSAEQSAGGCGLRRRQWGQVLMGGPAEEDLITNQKSLDAFTAAARRR